MSHTMANWSIRPPGRSWMEGNSIYSWRGGNVLPSFMLLELEGKFSPCVQLTQLGNFIWNSEKICIFSSFWLIPYQSISNKRYFISELKFEWPHIKIVGGSSSETSPNILTWWEGRKILFDEAGPTLEILSNLFIFNRYSQNYHR